MDMVIISTINNNGVLMEQYLVREAEGMELFMSILRRYEDSGFSINNGSELPILYEKARLYDSGRAILEKDDCKVSVYVREREVI